MKIKVSEATNAQLDWLVATCEGFVSEAEWEGDEVWMEHPRGRCGYSANFNYSTNWELGGSIIEREGIAVWPSESGSHDGMWCARQIDTYITYSPTPLIAAMRCFVTSKLGDEVEIPEELA